jgi:hypothetical protein
MIDDFIAACLPDRERGWQGRMTIFDVAFVDEEEVFVHKPNGRREHRSGKHDDRLFAGFIALQLHRRCPRMRTIPRWELPVERRPREPVYAGDVDHYRPGDG